MRRESVAARPDWRRRVEALGFDFHTIDGAPYWVEDGCYRFRADEIDRIEAAGNELHAMCLEAVAQVCGRGDFWRVGLGDAAAALAEASWRRGDAGLLGRMDLGMSRAEVVAAAGREPSRQAPAAGGCSGPSPLWYGDCAALVRAAPAEILVWDSSIDTIVVVGLDASGRVIYKGRFDQ